MKVRKVSADWDRGNCPTVYLSDSGTVIMQGHPVVAADGLSIGSGEMAVELPLDVVLSAIPTLQEK